MNTEYGLYRGTLEERVQQKAKSMVTCRVADLTTVGLSFVVIHG